MRRAHGLDVCAGEVILVLGRFGLFVCAGVVVFRLAAHCCLIRALCDRVGHLGVIRPVLDNCAVGRIGDNGRCWVELMVFRH